MKANLPFKYILTVKDGRKYVIFDFKDDNGKRKRKWVSTGLSEKATKKALNAKVEELVTKFYAEYCSGEATKVKTTERIDRTTLNEESLSSAYAMGSKRYEFVEFLHYWLETIKPTVAYTTYNVYVQYIGRVKKYFDAKYPHLLLTELTALQLQQFYNDLYNHNGLTGNTVKHYHANIHKALKYAVKMDLLASNPSEKTELPKVEKFKASFYTKEELNRLFEVFKGDRLELVVHIAAYYGLRRSEILGLKWDAVDFNRKTITICRKVTSITGSGHEEIRVDDQLKTEASERTLPLIPHIEEMLRERKVLETHYARLLKSAYDTTYDGFVCRDNFGKLITPSFVTQHFSIIINKYKLKKLRFHDLRHSCASLLLANGVPMKAIQEWLGHSTFNVTANFYSHLDYQSKLSSAETIARVLGGNEDEKNRKPSE